MSLSLIIFMIFMHSLWESSESMCFKYMLYKISRTLWVWFLRFNSRSCGENLSQISFETLFSIMSKQSFLSKQVGFLIRLIQLRYVLSGLEASLSFCKMYSANFAPVSYFIIVEMYLNLKNFIWKRMKRGLFHQWGKKYVENGVWSQLDQRVSIWSSFESISERKMSTKLEK